VVSSGFKSELMGDIMEIFGSANALDTLKKLGDFPQNFWSP
jgi:hypothetical protein